MRRIGMYVYGLLLLTAFSLRPGENDITPKQYLFMIKELVPGIQTVGILRSSSSEMGNWVEKIERAAAVMQVKVVIAGVADLKDVAKQFKNLIETHNIQALWVFEDDQVLNSTVSRKYLIKNANLSKIPLFAPSVDWINEGGCVNLTKEGGKVQLRVNEKTARILNLSIPEKYLPNTEFLAQK